MSSGQAERLARALLCSQPARWRHVAAVARRAATVATKVARNEADLVVAGAWLHDIGYADELVATGFHHLDGAVYLAGQGEERLAGLVAYHSAGLEESRLRGLGRELAVFTDEVSAVSEAVTYCDLTTRGDGSSVSLDGRLADVRARYGDEHVVTRALTAACPRLELLVQDVESLLGERVTR
jgi:hypothetical protein